MKMEAKVEIKKAEVESRARKVESAGGYGRSVRLGQTSAAAALERAKHAFGQEGLVVVAEIDFRDTFERNLDKEISPYWMVEIYNPSLADRALAIGHMAGLLGSLQGRRMAGRTRRGRGRRAARGHRHGRGQRDF
jgi:hypothetical protein